jgi:SpoVK/Ycf46/Vps4 family AAA+-type ATPase
MASADQMKALLKSHIDGDEQHFYSVAMQIAAAEAEKGHERLADELRSLVDIAKRSKVKNKTFPIARPIGELGSILSVSYPKARIADIVLSRELASQIGRIIDEQRFASRILEHGLSPRRKLLLVGPPGTGKTLTASALAGELGFPLFQVRLDGLITKFMGETAAKLRQVFEATEQTRGIYFFDEFDAIGSQRGQANDVGEIGRVLNSFLQMIEQDSSSSLIIAATNHPESLDRALFRRFDDVLRYALPDAAHRSKLLKARLCNYAPKETDWKRLSDLGDGLSYAELTRAAQEAVKEMLINGKAFLAENDIALAISERQDMAKRLEGIKIAIKN